MNSSNSMIYSRQFEMPLFPGKGLCARLANGLRRRFPRVAHTVLSLLRIPIADRYSAMIWTAILRFDSGTTPIVADRYADALQKLLNAGGQGSVMLSGLAYDVRPLEGEGFSRQSNAIVRRTYVSYEDYVRHQQSKFELERSFVSATSDKRYNNMFERFQRIVSEIEAKGTVICLASRLGEEVRAFRNLGLVAIGIDLNPGEKNPYTLFGDFHDIKFPDSSFDLVYCNSLDHVLDIERFMKEATRIVRAEGHIFFDLSGGYLESGKIDPYGASFWETNDALIAALAPYIREMRIDYGSSQNNGRQIVFKAKKIS